MVSVADFLTRAAAYARAHGVKWSKELIVSFILPFLIYNCVSGSLGNVEALMAASTPAIVRSIIALIRVGKVDAISILVLSGTALSLLAFVGGGGVKFLQLRENLVTGLVGLIFLGSVAIGRPLIFQLSRAGVRRSAADKVHVVDALRGDVRFRRSMTLATLCWGFGLLGGCALNCTLVFLVSVKSFLLISGPINTAIIGPLTAWTFWYVPRSMRCAAGRAAAAAQAEPADRMECPRGRRGDQAVC